MNQVNFDREMQKIIDGHRGEGKKSTLLLHACCAPCSTACIERLRPDFDLTVYFYNPNMDSAEEHEKRLDEQRKLCEAWNIPVISEEYASQAFYAAVRGLEREQEGGKRCQKCFELRLEKTAQTAATKGFDYFATTLTVSPLKNAALLNEIGKAFGQKHGVNFLPSDFKKRGGYKRSTELSRQYQMYRQNYCGCIFSKRENP